MHNEQLTEALRRLLSMVEGAYFAGSPMEQAVDNAKAALDADRTRYLDLTPLAQPPFPTYSVAEPVDFPLGWTPDSPRYLAAVVHNGEVYVLPNIYHLSRATATYTAEEALRTAKAFAGFPLSNWVRRVSL